MSQEQVIFRMSPRIGYFVFIKVENRKATGDEIFLSEERRKSGAGEQCISLILGENSTQRAKKRVWEGMEINVTLIKPTYFCQRLVLT